MRAIVCLCIGLVLSLVRAFAQTTGSPTYCPDALGLSPICVCSAASVNSVKLDCSGAENEDQLQVIFESVSFPVLHVDLLIIKNNQNLKFLSRNVFGDVTFNRVYFQDDVIEYVDSDAFLRSNSSLSQWNFIRCHLLPQGFPFDSLNLFITLDTLILDSAGKFDVLPRISSVSLQRIYIQNNEIRFLHNESFSDVPNVTTINLSFNNLTALVAGTFKDLEQLAGIDLTYNMISSSEPGAFQNLPKLRYIFLNYNSLHEFSEENLGYFPSLSGLYIHVNYLSSLSRDLLTGCPLLTDFSVSSNNLTSVEAGTFDVMEAGGTLNLFNNHLTTLDEEWLGSVLRNNRTFVDVSRNPLGCGCDLAWLFVDSSLMNNLNAACENGTRIQDLNSSFFADAC